MFVLLDQTVLVDRVRWFRAKAEAERYKEEIEILEEEIRRTFTSFSRLRTVWEALAHGPHKSGYSSYAYKIAASWGKLADDMSSRWHGLSVVPLEVIAAD